MNKQGQNSKGDTTKKVKNSRGVKKPIKSASLAIERRLWKDGFKSIAGVDEVGRGCLAGPVVAAAVILPIARGFRGITDSKLLSADEREAAMKVIFKKSVAVSVGICTQEEIDKVNILNASLEAMKRAVESLQTAADFLLIDGNKAYPCPPIPHYTLIKGDSRSLSIACASIIAKVTRDRIMGLMSRQFPDYGFQSNKGYPTPDHYRALKKKGPTPIHRKSFNLISPDMRT